MFMIPIALTDKFSSKDFIMIVSQEHEMTSEKNKLRDVYTISQSKASPLSHISDDIVPHKFE